MLTKAVLEAANDVGRAKKKPPSEKKEKSSSPKPREQSRGGGVGSDSNLDFLGSLATEVDTIAWATVGSGAATSCLPKEMCQTLDLAVKPVEEKPFTNASGQPVQVHGTCNPMVTIGEKGGPQVSGVGQFRAMDVVKPLLSSCKLVEHGCHLSTTRIVPSAWIQEGTSHYDWRSLQDRYYGFSWAAHRRVDGVSPGETSESIGSGDDEPGGSKLGSKALPTAAAPTQREKE